MPEDLNPLEAVTEATSAATTWDVLGGVGGLAAGISLLVLLYLQAKPRVNRWALLRFLHATYAYESSDLLTNEEARSLRLRQRLRRWRRRCGFWSYQRLMTMVHRVKARQLEDAFKDARTKMVATWATDDMEFPKHLTEDERDIVLEAAAVSRIREDRRRNR